MPQTCLACACTHCQLFFIGMLFLYSLLNLSASLLPSIEHQLALIIVFCSWTSLYLYQQQWREKCLSSSRCSSNRSEHMVVCCLLTTTTTPPFNFMTIWSWNNNDLLSHCSSNSPEHMVFFCSLTTPTTPASMSLPTCYWLVLYIPVYDKMLWSYDVHMKNSRHKRGLNN